MYVSINMDNLTFMHKHHDQEVVSALSWIECGTHYSVTVTPVDKARFVKTMTPMEMRLLYKNTCGGNISSEDPAVLRYQLSSLAELLSGTQANRDEVLNQAAQVEELVREGQTFKYAYGARTPAQPQALFPLKGRPLSTPELAHAAEWAASELPALTANAPCGPYPERRESEHELPADVSLIPATGKEPELVATFKKAKRANAKAEIWSMADHAWRAAGKPADQTALKELWKGLLPALEAQGLHPTTCRIKLAEWAKQRTPE